MYIHKSIYMIYIYIHRSKSHLKITAGLCRQNKGSRFIKNRFIKLICYRQNSGKQFVNVTFMNFKAVTYNCYNIFVMETV